MVINLPGLSTPTAPGVKRLVADASLRFVVAILAGNFVPALASPREMQRCRPSRAGWQRFLPFAASGYSALAVAHVEEKQEQSPRSLGEQRAPVNP